MFAVAGSAHRHRPAARRSARRQGPGVVLAPERAPAVRHDRSALGVRPGHRQRAVQGPGAQPALGVVVRADPRHRRQPRRVGSRPERADRPHRRAADGRGGRAGVHHRRHRHRPVDAVRRWGTGAVRPSTARRSHQERSRLDTPIVTPTTKGDHGGHDVPLSCADGRRPWARRSGAVGTGAGRRPGAVRPRHATGGAALRTDPRRHEVRVRADHRRRAAAHRRGPHAGLVTVVGSIDATPNGSPPATSPRASTRRSSGARSPTSATPARGPSPTLSPDVWTATTARYIDAFERLTGTDFVPGDYPAGPRIHAALAGLEIYS